MEFIKKNIKWIILGLIILILSNTLTGISVDSLTKKEKRAQKKKYDSLETRYKQLDYIHVTELAVRRKIFLEDSLLKLDYQKQIQKEQSLIVKQQQTINKFKHLPIEVNLSKLDSAYNAENN